jgi:hypothetical protein
VNVDNVIDGANADTGGLLLGWVDARLPKADMDCVDVAVPKAEVGGTAAEPKADIDPVPKTEVPWV